MGAICLASEVFSYFHLYHYRSILNECKIMASICMSWRIFEPVMESIPVDNPDASCNYLLSLFRV